MIVLAVTSAMGQIATDASVSKDASGASTTITTPAFSTSQANELLLAFVATDYISGTNTTVTSLSGGGLTWTLAGRSNAQAGDPSRGLMQVIGATFNAYKLPGHGDIYSPVDNIIAGVRYALSRYGSISNVPGVRSVNGGGQYVGY